MKANKNIRVGVFGSSQVSTPGLKEMAYSLGVALAEEGVILITGGSSGISLECSRGVASKNGRIISYLPERKIADKIDTIIPLESAKLIYSIEGGLKKRNLKSIANSDICVFVSGGWGTLNEFTLAIEKDIPKIVLKNTGGITDYLESLCTKLRYSGSVYFCSCVGDVIDIIHSYCESSSH